MDDKSNVSLVDAHTQRIGGHNTLVPVRHQSIFNVFSGFRIVPSVVVYSIHSILHKPFCIQFGVNTCSSVYEARSVNTVQMLGKPYQFVVFRLYPNYIQFKIRTDKASPYCFQLSTYLPLYVVLDTFCGRRRCCEYWQILRKQFYQIYDTSKRGAEIVTPYRNGVGLVNNHHRKIHPSCGLYPFLIFLTFRSYVEYLDFAVQCSLNSGMVFFQRLFRIDISCRYAFAVKRFDLVAHQGY